MSIAGVLARSCVQTAVYWGTPVKDGRGGYTFATAVEILCRWEDGMVLVKDGKGKELIVDAQVCVLQDLDKEGFLYLGTLASLTTAQKANPRLITTARQILVFRKSPSFGSTTEFVRIAYTKE